MKAKAEGKKEDESDADTTVNVNKFGRYADFLVQQ